MSNNPFAPSDNISGFWSNFLGLVLGEIVKLRNDNNVIVRFSIVSALGSGSAIALLRETMFLLALARIVFF